MLISRHAPSVSQRDDADAGRAADAEDVAQETFVSAYKALPRFQFEREVLDLAVPDRRQQVHMTCFARAGRA